jgi:signal transduction histidine kinase
MEITMTTNLFTKLLKEFGMKNIRFSIISINNLIIIINAILYYYLIPNILNYPPDFIEYNKRFEISFLLQIIIVVSFIIIVSSLVLYRLLSEVNTYEKLSKDNNKDYEEKVKLIRDKCISLPYYIYIIQIVLPIIPFIIFGVIYSAMFKTSWIIIAKTIILVLSFFTLTAIINFIISKGIFTEILIRTYTYQNIDGKRIVLSKKIFLILLPLGIVAILFSSLLGYSKVLDERGSSLSREYKTLLEAKLSVLDNVEDINQIRIALSNVNIDNTKVSDFIVSPNGQIAILNGEALGDYFIRNMNLYSQKHNGRIYTENAEYNGEQIRVKGNHGVWTIGVKYYIASDGILHYFSANFLTLLCFCIIVLFFISKSIAKDISFVGSRLLNIANGDDINAENKIPVTSNDEIGDLVIAFNKLREREIEYDKLKTEFMANISHELRTPINVMFTAIQLVESYTKEELIKNFDKSNRNFKRIKQNCLRLTRLVNNLIDITKMDAGFIKLQLQPLNIVSLTKEITESVVEFAKSKDISLKFETQIDEKVTISDADKIERIILNLLSNAIKFTKQGGSISVKVNDKGESVILSVKDTGIGIPKNKQKIIFERFRQVEQSLVKSCEGSGIGLSLVKHLVEMHEGKIRVESEEGVGSEFIIELPVKMQSLDGISQENNNYFTNSNIVEKIKIEFSDIYFSN